MGAQQSSSRNGGGVQDSGLVKRDYYEVLEINRQATDDEIKKAYRRKALDLHPDRNYGDVENATARFAEVQSAYEVLSDSQERAWYDSHRDSILRGDAGGVGEKDHYEYNVRLTNTRDIVNLMSRFNASVPFTDAPNGFYGILAETFANLAREEDAACDWEDIESIDYPGFGSAKDNYEDVVRPFYRVWASFSTKKSFSWKDQHKASNAPDRATRRIIEKENKKLRDEGIRDFNDAVRTLVAFVRKRDPRYISNLQTEADRQKILRDATAAQASKARAANQAKFNAHVVPDWTRTKEPEEEVPFSESEEEEVEHIECLVCGKTFKSEKQYETHAKSKKHQKAVQLIQREMRKENKCLNLGEEFDSYPSPPMEEGFEKLDVQGEDDEVVKEGSVPKGNAEENGENAPDDEDGDNKQYKEPEPEVGKPSKSSSDAPDTDDEYGSREDVENRLLGSLTRVNDSNAISAAVSESDSPSQLKLGKAKAKRVKRAAHREAEAQADHENKCAACQVSFPSKTKLFAHIKGLGHAQPLPKAGKEKNKKR